MSSISTIGRPGDQYELEADNTADKVLAMPDPQLAVQRQAEDSEGEAPEEAEEQEPETIQAKPLMSSITALRRQVQRAGGMSGSSPSVESRLQSSRGGGSPLPQDVKSYMEPRFGADFSQVRVHTDSTAVQLSRELGAQAFAYGNDVYYGAGKYPGKDHLTAHELTHTIQQTGGVNLKRDPDLRVRRSPEPTNDHLTAHELTHTVQQGAVVRATPQPERIKANSPTPAPSLLQAQEDPSLLDRAAQGLQGAADQVWQGIQGGAQKLSDFGTAISLAHQYIPETIGRHVEEALQEVLVGMAIGLVGAAGLLAVTTTVGAAVGSLAGGVGAAPGAAVGAKVGLFLLNWMGIGFLVAWIGSRIAEIGVAFGTFVDTVWNANGNREIIDRAAREYAEAVALFLAFVLEGLVAYAMAHGIQKAVQMVGNSWFGRRLGSQRLTEWLRGKIGAGNLEPGNPRSSSLPRSGNRTTMNQINAPNHGNTACGPTSCGMILDTAGNRVDLGVLVRQTRTGPAGSRIDRLASVLRSNGVTNARWVRNATIDDLARATAQGHPVITHMRLDRGGHFVVIDGVTMRQGQRVVAIRDPAGGRQYFTPVTEFIQRWSGQSVFTNPTP